MHKYINILIEQRQAYKRRSLRTAISIQLVLSYSLSIVAVCRYSESELSFICSKNSWLQNSAEPKIASDIFIWDCPSPSMYEYLFFKMRVHVGARVCFVCACVFVCSFSDVCVVVTENLSPVLCCVYVVVRVSVCRCLTVLVFVFLCVCMSENCYLWQILWRDIVWFLPLALCWHKRNVSVCRLLCTFFFSFCVCFSNSEKCLHSCWSSSKCNHSLSRQHIVKWIYIFFFLLQVWTLVPPISVVLIYIALVFFIWTGFL